MDLLYVKVCSDQGCGLFMIFKKRNVLRCKDSKEAQLYWKAAQIEQGEAKNDWNS